MAPGAAFPGQQTLQLPIDFLRNGFSRTRIYSNGQITVPGALPLGLTPGSTLQVTGARINVGSNITALGGSLLFTARDTAGLTGGSSFDQGIFVAPAVALDLRGQWTNDYLLDPAVRPVDPLFVNGGVIDFSVSGLNGSTLSLGDAVALRVSGGAQGTRSGTLVAGNGGQISLRTNGNDSRIEIGKDVALDAFGVFGGKGGSFTLAAPRVQIASGNSWSGAQNYDPAAADSFFEVGSALFSDYGFSSFLLSGSRPVDASGTIDVVRVAADTAINVRTFSRLLNGDSLRRSGGGVVDSFSSVFLPPEYQRSSASVVLRAALSDVSSPGSDLAGNLEISKGAVLTAEPGSSFTFSSVGNLFIDGSVTAPAGIITAGLQNPSGSDTGYRAEQRMELGSTASLDVSGVSILAPNDSGLLRGSVLSGGTINLLSDRGALITDKGSVLNASGTSATLDILSANAADSYLRQTVSSAGGAITIRAPEAILLNGQALAAAGVGDQGVAAGGSLTVQLTRNRGFRPGSGAEETFPTNPSVLTVVEHDAADAEVVNGSAIVSQDFLRSTGADAITLEAGNQVSLQSGLNLSFDRLVSLDAPVISIADSGPVKIDAGYVSIGQSTYAFTTPVSALRGAGTLDVHAGFIELLGTSVLSGIGQASLVSSGDIRLRGSLRDDGTSAGSLDIAGFLSLQGQRIYGSTNSAFRLQASGGLNNRIEIGSTGASPGTPLSAGSSLTLIAQDIVQGGTLLAPFGSISMQAGNTLRLTDGSLTSVSGNGITVPYGSVQVSDWTYAGKPISGIPDRRVTLQGPSVTTAATASIDVRGGGDLYAYQWVPGTGGSKDALASVNTPGLYAILPSLRGQVAPYDPQEYAGSNLTPGASVYLAGGGGVDAGVYPLLPARYALLPGAFLVSAVQGSSIVSPGTQGTLVDGTPVVAGYFAFANSTIGSNQFTTFSVRPGSYGRALAQYDDFFASTFFAARSVRLEQSRPDLPADSGTLAFIAGQTLDAKGSVLTAADTNGRGASIDIAAEQLEIISGNASTSDSSVQVSAEQLASWNPASLLIGGQRSRASDGSTQVSVSAETVTVKQGADLSLGEVILTARDRISLESGSVVSSKSGQAAGTVPTLAAEPTVLQLSADDGGAPAFLAVSDLSALSVTRAAGAARQGQLDVAAGATLASRGAMTLDAPGGAVLQGDFTMEGARTELNSNRIVFGDAPVDGAMLINSGLDAELRTASQLKLAAAQSLELQRNVALDLDSSRNTTLEIDTALLQSNAGVSTTFRASNILLSGADVASANTPAVGSGVLALTADEIMFGSGFLDASGFASSSFAAARQVTGIGAGDYRTSGDLDVTTPRFALDSKADTVIEAAQGKVRLLGSPLPAGQVLPALQLGGSLNLSSADLEVSTVIAAPSGAVTLSAANDMVLANGASVDVAGREVTAAGRQVGSGGGAIRLLSGAGVSAAAGSSLLLDGAGESDAGRLSVEAGGSASLLGTVSAKAADAASGGRFDLQAASLDDFSALNDTLEQAGFNALRSVHVASGDLNLGAGDRLTAHTVELITDGGAVNVAGTVTTAASGDGAGAIRLYGHTGVSLAAGGVLNADAAGGAVHGGTIELGTDAGSINLVAGSVVSASGDASDGRLLLRAPAVNGDMSVASIGSTISGVKEIDLFPVIRFDVSNAPTSGELDDIKSTVGSFVDANAAAILGRLGSPSGIATHLRPAVELRQSGDLSLEGIDLSTWRFAGEPVAFDVLAGGSLTLNGALSDGFTTVSTPGGDALGLLDGPSASISLVAGADLTSAYRLSLQRGSQSDLILGSGALLRSGSGDLSLAAARDIVISSAGAAVYTGGIAGAPSQTIQASPRRFVEALFPTDGGSISLQANRDIVGTPLTQSVSAWQFRQGSAPGASIQRARLVAVNATDFGWNVGSLGGGNVAVSAGRDVVNLSAAAADSTIVNPDDTITRFGGGSMSVDAGRNIGTGMFYIAGSDAHLKAGNALTSTRTDSTTGAPLGTFLSTGDTRTVIDARRDVFLESVSNPTVLPQPGVANNRSSYFFTYGEDSSLSLLSTAGDISLYGNPFRLADFVGQDSLTTGDPSALSIFPSSLYARAFTGDFLLPDGTAYLFPSSRGQLDVFAARDVATSQAGTLVLSDGSVDGLGTLLSPQAAQTLAEAQKFASASRHVGDSQPVLITAGRDIVGMTFNLAKFAQVTAGRDIFGTSLNGQNLDPSELTLVRAGRDFAYASGSTLGGILWGGPGRFDLLAGREVDLGFSRGIASTGRIINASIPFDEGASVTVMAGLGQEPDYAGFITKIIADAPDYKDQLIATVEAATGQKLPYDQALAKFQTLNSDMQRPLVDAVFFAELVKSGREANTVAGAGYNRGYAAVDALFPGSRKEVSGDKPNPYSGNINMAFSRIYTLAGGDISLFVPGGLLNVGLANPPSFLSGRPASELGIVAQGTGNVDIYTSGDVLVNQSRVFTLLGGDIAIWSTEGNIDAGRGAKSALSAPPPRVLVDANGRVTLDFTGAVSGSGIRTILTSDSVTPGNVDLIAPSGFVNAGDAGIGSAGNINIAAQQVIGLDNIQFGGAATGVPAETSGLGAALAGVSGVASSSSNASSAAVAGKDGADKASPIAQSALSWLDVFVTGLGEENCKQDDLECLKRQKRTR